MSEDIGKLERRLAEETIFWEFRELFSKFCNRRRSDLPEYKTPAFKLDPFKLAEIFYSCKDDPSPALLMDAVEFRSRLMEKLFEDYYETLSHHLLDCFKAARQQLRIDQHTEKLVGESADRLREHGKSTTDPTTEIRGKRRANGSKRAMPENVAFRRALVKGFEKANPRLKGKTLTLETCRWLDTARVDVPEAWKEKYKIETWEAGYRHGQVKGLIESMFSTDRNTPF